MKKYSRVFVAAGYKIPTFHIIGMSMSHFRAAFMAVDSCIIGLAKQI